MSISRPTVYCTPYRVCPPFDKRCKTIVPQTSIGYSSVDLTNALRCTEFTCSVSKLVKFFLDQAKFELLYKILGQEWQHCKRKVHCKTARMRANAHARTHARTRTRGVEKVCSLKSVNHTRGHTDYRPTGVALGSLETWLRLTTGVHVEELVTQKLVL